MLNMTEEEWVSGEGWVSDDSSFYGDEEEQERLLSRCKDYTTTKSWAHIQKDINSLLVKTRNTPPPDLHNIYEGEPDAWQLGEPVSDFLQRLPPETTSVSLGPWIWVANPYPDGQDSSGRARVYDELIPRGQQLLQDSLQERERILRDNPRMNSTATRKLNQEAESLKQHIAALAEETNILSGKWMLFPSTKNLTRVWEMVVEGTIGNRLGSAAKVATDQGESGTTRLICVYTRDYRDTEDVLRVIQELDAMGLVPPGKGLYYKADAYTYLNIYGNNEYGLQASLYSSQKLLASAKSQQARPNPQKKQSTLEAAFKKGKARAG